MEARGLERAPRTIPGYRGLGFRDIAAPIMENEMEKNLKHEMEHTL